MQTTLEKVCAILGYSPQESENIMKLYVETILFNHAAEIIEMIPADKKTEFESRLSAKDVNPDDVVMWLKDTLNLSPEQSTRLSTMIDQSSREFFVKLFENISEDKKSQILSILPKK